MRLQTRAGAHSPLAAANTARPLNPYRARGVRNWRRIGCSSGAVAAPAGGAFAGAAGLGWGLLPVSAAALPFGLAVAGFPVVAGASRCAGSAGFGSEEAGRGAGDAGACGGVVARGLVAAVEPGHQLPPPGMTPSRCPVPPWAALARAAACVAA